MSEPCNCDQALAYAEVLSKIAEGGYGIDAARVAASNVLQEWNPEVTITVRRTQDITVIIINGDIINAMDEDGNRAHLTEEERVEVFAKYKKGRDETGR